MRTHPIVVALLCMTLGLALIGAIVAPAVANEIDNRAVVTYPSSDTVTTMTSSGFTIPSGPYQDAFFSGASIIIADDTVADSGFAHLDRRIDLARNDLDFTYRIQTPAWSVWGTLANDFGSAFVLYNDPTYLPSEDSDYGMLAIYKNIGNPDTTAISNSIAVEFDNVVSNNSADRAIASNTGSHVAITHPGQGQTEPTPHYALSPLATPYANNTTNTAQISWSLTDPGTTDALTDNVYTLSYAYYQGAVQATGAPRSRAARPTATPRCCRCSAARRR